MFHNIKYLIWELTDPKTQKLHYSINYWSHLLLCAYFSKEGISNLKKRLDLLSLIDQKTQEVELECEGNHSDCQTLQRPFCVWSNEET